VFLIASIVTIVDSIDLTVLTIYGYTRAFTPVIPRAGRLRVDPQLQDQIRKMPQTDKIIEAGGFFFNINTVFGRLPFVCFGVNPAQRDYLIGRAGDKLAEGRMPAEGQPEAVVSEGIVRNRRLKLGDVLAAPTDTGSLVSVPVPVKLVGILSGPTWIAFTSRQFSDAALPLVPHSVLVTTHNVADQVNFGDTLMASLDKVQVQVFSFHSLVKELRDTLSSMYLIMSLVNGTVILVVALMSGMLSAIGIPRRILLVHAVSETAILTAIGWIVGSGVDLAFMAGLRGSLFEPRGMLINPTDPLAYFYTAPIPVCITLFAVATVGYRLSRLDPVTIIERR